MLISTEYKEQQKKLHETAEYGTESIGVAPFISQIINSLGVRELLDYGAGRGNLMKHLKVGHPMQIQCYDPAVEEWAGTPIPSQMVCCIDVLEHVEPDCLEEVLDDIQRVTMMVAYISVSTVPSKKTLEDGRNAHLNIQTPEWWLEKLIKRFEVNSFQRTPNGFWTVLYAKQGIVTLATQ